MLIGAGLTAFYTFRMVCLVFFGEARDHLHFHPAGPAMRISLGILAVGTSVTWLFFGELNEMFLATLPFHELEHESLLELATIILSAPATWLALGVVAAGFGFSWVRARGYRLFGGGWLKPFVDTSFGFEPVISFVVQGISRLAEHLRLTQTGELNWNILGILSGLLVVLVILWTGA
jgi:NADH-quinone oxidoreductase subunit L